MSLCNLEYGFKKIDPFRLGNSQLLKALKKSIPSVSWDKIVRIVDGAIEDSINDDITKLSWCCTGSMLGNTSKRPHGDITYIWEKISNKVGKDRMLNMTIGTLVQWRISLRDEEWYCNRVPTDSWDDENQCYVCYYQYWIKPQ